LAQDRGEQETLIVLPCATLRTASLGAMDLNDMFNRLEQLDDNTKAAMAAGVAVVVIVVLVILANKVLNWIVADDKKDGGAWVASSERFLMENEGVVAVDDGEAKDQLVGKSAPRHPLKRLAIFLVVALLVVLPPVAVGVAVVVRRGQELHMKGYGPWIERLYQGAFYTVRPLTGTRLSQGSGLDIPPSLSRKTVVITGGTKGCGFHAATRFHGLDADVLITGRSNSSAAEAAEKVRRKTRGRGLASGLGLDLTDFDSVTAFARQAASTFPRIDYLVLNAGYSQDGQSFSDKRLKKMGLAAIDKNEVFSKYGHSKVYTANHLGHFLLTMLLAPYLAPSSTVVVVSSVTVWWSNPNFLMLWWGKDPKPENPPRKDVPIKEGFGKEMYSASKLANYLMARSLRTRLARLNVSVACLTPGEVATDIHRRQNVPGVPAVRGGEKVFEAAFVTRRPMPDFLYPYWFPWPVAHDFKFKTDRYWTDRERLYMYIPEKHQTLDYTLHAGNAPRVGAELERELWVWSRKAVGLPERLDDGSIVVDSLLESGWAPPRPNPAALAAAKPPAKEAAATPKGGGKTPAKPDAQPKSKPEAKTQAKPQAKPQAKTQAKAKPKPLTRELQEIPGGVKGGVVFPLFVLEDDSRNQVSMDSFPGKKKLIYWYPKADTPGCTAEGNGFTKLDKEYQKLGVQILGASADTPEENRAFSKKFGFTFPLLSDPTRAIPRAMGKTGRWAVLVGEKGKVIRFWPAVDAAAFPGTALAWMRENPEKAFIKRELLQK